MKASELIDALQKQIDYYGDQEVIFTDEVWNQPAETVSLVENVRIDPIGPYTDQKTSGNDIGWVMASFELDYAFKIDSY